MSADRFAAASLKDFTIKTELFRSQKGAVYKAEFIYDNKLYVLKERIAAELGRKKDMMNEVQFMFSVLFFRSVNVK